MTDTKISQKPGWLFAHHITFEFMTPMNLIVTCVYWSILREGALVLCPTPVTWIHTTCTHLLPIVFNLIMFI